MLVLFFIGGLKGEFFVKGMFFVYYFNGYLYLWMYSQLGFGLGMLFFYFKIVNNGYYFLFLLGK